MTVCFYWKFYFIKNYMKESISVLSVIWFLFLLNRSVEEKQCLNDFTSIMVHQVFISILVLSKLSNSLQILVNVMSINSFASFSSPTHCRAIPYSWLPYSAYNSSKTSRFLVFSREQNLLLFLCFSDFLKLYQQEDAS